MEPKPCPLVVTRDEWLTRLRALIEEYASSLVDWYGETPGLERTRLPDEVEDDLDSFLNTLKDVSL